MNQTCGDRWYNDHQQALNESHLHDGNNLFLYKLLFVEQFYKKKEQ